MLQRSAAVGTIFLLLWLAAVSDVGAGERIDRSCLRSLSVRDGIFELDNMTMSCVAVEKARPAILKTIETLDGSRNYAELAKQAADLKAKVRKASKERTKAALGALVKAAGHYGAMFGLATCVESLGAGCLISAVGAVMAKIEIVDSTINASELQRRLNALSRDLTRVQNTLKRKRNKLRQTRDVLVSEFNRLCTAVKNRCLR